MLSFVLRWVLLEVGPENFQLGSHTSNERDAQGCKLFEMSLLLVDQDQINQRAGFFLSGQRSIGAVFFQTTPFAHIGIAAQFLRARWSDSTARWGHVANCEWVVRL